MGGQQLVYADQPGQQVINQGQQVVYVDQQGQVVDPGQQMIYSTQGQQVVQQGQVLQMAPPVYNISPEQFATLAQGGTLSQEQINGMMGVAPGVPQLPQQPAGAAPTESGSPPIVGPGMASGTPPAPTASKKKKSEKA